MPYIKQDRREILDPHVKSIVDMLNSMDAKDGDYNYLITRILASGFKLDTDPKYSKINTIVGILECVKLELYRRISGKYEELKALENEDVLEYEIFDRWFNDEMMKSCNKYYGDKP